MINWRAIPHAKLAAFAARELALRVAQWPAAVDAGRMTQAEADDDILAWRAIADLLEHGRTDVDRIWTEIIAAVDHARARRRLALDEAFEAGSPKIDGLVERLWLLTALSYFARDQRDRQLPAGRGPIAQAIAA